MFVGETVLYFASIRNLTSAFGSLFNNITITRFSDVGGQGTKIRTIKVPLTYASGDKSYVFRAQHTPSQQGVQTKISLPRIAFKLVDIGYNPAAKLQTTNANTASTTTDPVQYIKQLNPVPYDFFYEVYIASKTIDDGFQIIEQILPNFSPSFNLTVKELPQLGITRDVPVIFNQISNEDYVEGQFEEERILMWTLSFTVKGYLYPNITDGNIIRKVLTSIYNTEDMALESKQEVIQVSVNPIDAEEDEDWDAVTTIYDSTQLDTNGDPIIV